MCHGVLIAATNRGVQAAKTRRPAAARRDIFSGNAKVNAAGIYLRRTTNPARPTLHDQT
jgi:hypothetical protein